MKVGNVGLSEESRKIRATGVGASESSALFGMNPFLGVIELWREKCGIEGRNPPSKIFWGNLLEPVIAAAYTRETGNRVIRRQKTLRHKQRPQVLCTPDYKVIGKPVNVQVKTASPFYAAEWGEQWTNEIPDYYIIQVQQEMEVLDYPVTHVPVLIGNNDFRIYVVERDREMGLLICEAIEKFWHCVESGVMPEPLTVNDYKRILANQGQYVSASPVLLMSWLELQGIIERIEADQKKKNEIEDDFRKAIGANEGVIDALGKPLATWKSYKRKGKPYRQLKVKRQK